MKVFLTLVLVALIQFNAVTAAAATIEEGEKMLQEAVAEVAAVGGPTAAKKFVAGSKWQMGTTYLVLSDFAGQVLAHTFNPKMVGKNMLEAKDAAGNAFVQQCLRNIKATGKSQVPVKWGNPVTHKFAQAEMISRRVPGTEFIVNIVVFP